MAALLMMPPCAHASAACELALLPPALLHCTLTVAWRKPMADSCLHDAA